MSAKTRFARNGDVELGYRIWGDGPHDIVFVPDWTATRMRSRICIALVAIVALAVAVVAEAQHVTNPVIGVLSGQSREWRQSSLDAFRQALRALAWQDGQNLRA